MGRKAELGPRFSRALAYASRLHRGQKRKGTTIPYVAHLLAVAALVIEAGGDEDTAIAALLHDAVEDQGGRKTLREIRRRYGKRVARIVEQNTDAEVIPKPPWKERKLKYLRAIPRKTSRARLVSLADKLHNAEAILADYRRLGETLWSRFNGGRKGTLWYYRELVKAFGKKPANRELMRRLKGAVRELKRRAARPARKSSEGRRISEGGPAR
jgi:(p)ppGpp synthase/HD superfamily hydrolase